MYGVMENIIDLFPYIYLLSMIFAPILLFFYTILHKKKDIQDEEDEEKMRDKIT